MKLTLCCILCVYDSSDVACILSGNITMRSEDLIESAKTDMILEEKEPSREIKRQLPGIVAEKKIAVEVLTWTVW